MGRITRETKLEDVFAMEELAGLRRYLVYAPDTVAAEDLPTHGFEDLPLSALSSLGWSASSIARGMNALVDAIAEGRVALHYLYGQAHDPAMADVNVCHLRPRTRAPRSPLVILCSGGSYKNVCTLAEGVPVGTALADEGYDVFLLTYRVSVPAVAPLALDDLAAALRYLTEHADALGVDPTRYVVGGFSAGANLAGMWGCPSMGYAAYGFERPLLELLAYPIVDLELESHRNERFGAVPRMLGEDAWRERLRDLDVASHIDEGFPPSYLVCGRNDGLITCRHSELLKERLDAVGVPCVLEERDDAPHGFGDGTGTEAAGWVGRACAFLWELV